MSLSQRVPTHYFSAEFLLCFVYQSAFARPVGMTTVLFLEIAQMNAGLALSLKRGPLKYLLLLLGSYFQEISQTNAGSAPSSP